MPTLGLNALFAAGSNLLGIRFDPYLAYNFLVEIEGLVIGGFSEVSGLEVETEVEEYREGGQNAFVHKFAGATRYPNNLTLKRGLIDLDTLWGWHQDITQGRITRRNCSLYLLDHQRLPIMWWDFVGAYPVKWSGPQFNAASDAVAFESVEFAHQGFTKPEGNRLLAAARAAIGGAASLL